MLDILYFASLKEVLGQSQEKIEIKNPLTVSDLLASLADRGDNWAKALQNNPNLQIAVNQDMADRQTPLKAGDEVAFFPPVTGG